ncbi:hypothetical protein [Deinococcus puniceus]|uniref:Uncharacterized protein n=1 Tax=Deinococcus puniceus TaxID=1182568 RepID=A0A172T6K0_9DEIO|nr:hypothetical protein [Deinococcus puniceus]ANE42443.1 hypothetical protein SU48_00210 [Deinococcus puniceus]
MTGPYDRPPAPATEPTDTPLPRPERLPGGDDLGPMTDPPVNPDTPGFPEPQPTDNPDTPAWPNPMPMPAM